MNPNPENGSGFRSRLDQIWKSYEDALQITPEAELAILQNRAREAAAVHAKQAATRSEEVLRFTAGDEQYAVPTRHAWEIARTGQVARLPLAPRHLAGVTNLRGLILPLVDLHALLRNPAGDPVPAPFFIVMGKSGPDVGVLAQALHGFEELCAGDMLPLPRSGNHPARSLTRGLTPDGVLVLDDLSLLQDPRLYFGSTPSR